MQRVVVAKVEDVPLDTLRAIEAMGRKLVLANVGGDFFALSDRCTHEGAALSGGTLDGYILKCPVHGAMFDVRTGYVQHTGKNIYGLPVGGPSSSRLATFEVLVDAGDIVVLL
ncbi:MAG: Rieske 2Fe-2S domain-containing protein [Dehalococcoidia bacterium]|nr:Rieske 2Fe-2S domain-containing protein [Dehalococcoidia bacterium]